MTVPKRTRILLGHPLQNRPLARGSVNHLTGSVFQMANLLDNPCAHRDEIEDFTIDLVDTLAVDEGAIAAAAIDEMIDSGAILDDSVLG